MALERVRAQKPGDNPSLLITLLAANWPDKYRPNAIAIAIASNDTAKEVILNENNGSGKLRKRQQL